MEASMPLRGTPSPDNRGTDWLGIARTLALQVLALLALAGAFIVYLDWASDVAFEEFIGVSTRPAASLASQPPSANPVKRAKSQVPCEPKT
jgi:hypothetical protein